MLFAVDVGNTNITVGLFDGKELVKQFRMITKTSRTSDEYGVYFRQWLSINGFEDTSITDVIISSAMAEKYGLKKGDEFVVTDEDKETKYAFSVKYLSTAVYGHGDTEREVHHGNDHR